MAGAEGLPGPGWKEHTTPLSWVCSVQSDLPHEGFGACCDQGCLWSTVFLFNQHPGWKGLFVKPPPASVSVTYLEFLSWVESIRSGIPYASPTSMRECWPRKCRGSLIPGLAWKPDFHLSADRLITGIQGAWVGRDTCPRQPKVAPLENWWDILLP